MYYIENINPFDIDKTLSCGQAFRWIKKKNKVYLGVLENDVFEIIQEAPDKLFVKTTKNESKKYLERYLGLNIDYNKYNFTLSKNEKLKDIINYSEGIRILNQPHFECLVSYIISANNMVPRIMKSVLEISRKFGKKIIYEDENYYSFPSPEILANVSLQDLRECGVGFRDKYIIDAAKKVLNGEVCLDKLENLTCEDARNELIKINGVGRKVADCVLLYSYHRYEVFPIDVWIKRIMEKIFLDGNDIKKLEEMQKYAKDEFGELAGLTNIYLYYYARNNIKFL